MEINNTNFQLQTIMLSYCTMIAQKKNFKYMGTYIDPASCSEYLYPLICFLSESEFSYFFNRKNLDESRSLFLYEENVLGSIFKPIKVSPTQVLGSISFSMIAPFFFFWLKMIVEKYFDKLELIYIHFPKESIFKN